MKEQQIDKTTEGTATKASTSHLIETLCALVNGEKMALDNPDPYERKRHLEHWMPKAMPTDQQSEVAKLTERVERLLELLEPPSAMVITGKRAVEEYQALITRGA